MKKRTKIVATISDHRCEVEFLKQLYRRGMNVVRLNTAHQEIAGTLKVIKNVRKVSDRIPLLLDTKGPEIRTTEIDKSIKVQKGDFITIKGGADKKSTREVLYVSYNKFAEEVPVGSHILIDDGELVVNGICSAREGKTIYGEIIIQRKGWFGWSDVENIDVTGYDGELYAEEYVSLSRTGKYRAKFTVTCGGETYSVYSNKKKY